MVEEKGKKRIKKYELMVIMKALLPDNLRRDFNEKLVKLVANAGGKILSKEVWGKKYLSYPIKSHKEGYYVLYQLELPSEKVGFVNKELRLSNELLRHLLIKED